MEGYGFRRSGFDTTDEKDNLNDSERAELKQLIKVLEEQLEENNRGR